MDRDHAERVFRLVADLHGELRDRLVPDRWWLVWALMGVEILVTNAITHLLLARGTAAAFPHAGVFAAQVLALAATIRVAQRHGGGTRPRREAFVWWIWTTFLLTGVAALALNGLLGLPPFRTACVLPLLAAVSFSAMGMAVDRVFTLAAGAFGACAFAMAAFPAVQFLVYGTTWFVVLEAFAVLHYPRRPAVGRPL